VFRSKCLGCQGSIVEVIDLGLHPFADRFISLKDAARPDQLYPLIVDRCVTCGLAQSRTVTNPKERYANYSYVSSHSATSRAHWDDFARDIAMGLDVGDLVVEIGSNDGYLCAAFQKLGRRAIGVDPSADMAGLATARGVKTYCGFFDQNIVSWIKEGCGAPKLIVANNVLNHADDLEGFLAAVYSLLGDNGTFVFQVPSWRTMVESKNFDQVYHEHVTYWSERSAISVLSRYGLFVSKVEEVNYHGTSLRIFASKCKSVGLGVGDAPGFGEVAWKQLQCIITGRRNGFLRRVLDVKGPVVAAGASAKGNTFLNWHRLDHSLINAVTDVSEHKVGKLTPGTRIPIVTDEFLGNFSSPTVIVTTWNLADAIKPRLLKINPNVKFMSITEST
jgi:2-polyprenyl-3-methyl-5-hydroxy-6-metoxy-1,4-benzoquinol methylase